MFYVRLSGGISGLLLICSLITANAAETLVRESNTTLRMPQRPIFGGFELVNAYGPLLFSNPVSIDSPPGETNRLFISERAGRVVVIANLASPGRATYLDLTAETDRHSIESGLLGLAFHPGFATNRYFFIFRTAWVPNQGFHNVVSRFRQSATNPSSVEAGSEHIILSVPDPSEEHNAGDIQFGPDGYLYVPMGDVGGGVHLLENKQPIDESLFGGILRIDVDERPENLQPNPLVDATLRYRVPRDNPFVGIIEYQGRSVNAGKVRTEFFAVGFRNPWRITFHPQTGALLAGDVGGGMLEEVNVVEKGMNYGWPYFEGKLQILPLAEGIPSEFEFSPPWIAYEHGTDYQQGFAVIGGIFYQGQNIPELNGAYLFADNLSGNLWTAEYPPEAAVGFSRLTGETGISAFGRDPVNNEVLVVNHETGSLKRLVFHPPAEANVPLTLQDTGVYQDLHTLAPNPGIVPYEINLSFWSDNAIKTRLFSIPEPDARMGFDPDGNWSFPPGTVWIKHFEIELTNGIPESRKRLETRLIVKNLDQVYGVTYRWDDSQTNAFLVKDFGETETLRIHNGEEVREQQWRYPSRAECLRCHTRQAGFALGFSTAQLNREVHYGAEPVNQILALSSATYLDESVTDTAPFRVLAEPNDSRFPLEHRARSFLAVNCSYCHQPESWSTLGAFWDGRLATPLSATYLLTNYVTPGAPEHSRLFQRIARENELMPPIATSVLNTNGIELLRRWIGGLPREPWMRTDVGAPHLEGSSTALETGFELSGAGYGFNSGSDQFHFLWQRLTGSVQVVARIRPGPSFIEGAAAGIMLRESSNAASPYAMVLHNPEHRASFSRRVAAGGPIRETIGEPQGPAGWVKLVGENGIAKGFQSVDGLSWISLGADELAGGNELLVGLGTASGEPYRYTSAAFEELSILAAELIAPANDSAHQLPGGLLFSARIFPGSELVKKVEFRSGTNMLGECVAAPFDYLWTNGLNGVHLITARVHDLSGNSFVTAPITVTLLPPVARSVYDGSDLASSGDWKPFFGREGYVIAAGGESNPESMHLSLNGAAPFTWETATSDHRALINSTNDTRVAAAWSATNTLTLEVDLRDGNLHRVSLYFLDWDALGRVQSIAVQDAHSGETLDNQTISNFSGGAYLTWTVRGHVRFLITSPEDGEAILSGVFVDPSPHQPAVVELRSPPDGSEFMAPTNILVSATLREADGLVNKAEFFANRNKIGEDQEPPFEVVWQRPLAADYEVFVRVTDDLGEVGESPPARVSVGLPAASVIYLGADTRTDGNWVGAYGMEGYSLAAEAESRPAYLASEGSDTRTYVWSRDTLDPRALLAGDSGRIAACWVDEHSFSFDLEILDGLPHLLSCYFVDWDSVARRQVIRISSLEESSVLDARETGEFHFGTYLSWLVSGKVRVTVERMPLSGNVVLSGLFFDSGEVPPRFESINVQDFSPQPSVTFSWRTIPGREYRIQYRHGLEEGEWIDMPGDVLASEIRATVTRELDAAGRQIYFRILLLP